MSEHAHFPNFIKGLVIAVIIGVVFVGIFSKVGTGDKARTTIDDLSTATAESLQQSEFVKAIQTLDRLLDTSEKALVASQNDEAQVGFKKARDLSVRAQARVRETVLKGEEAPVSEDRFSFRAREAISRYYLSVCLFRALEAGGYDPTSGDLKIRDGGRALTEIGQELSKAIKADDGDKRYWRLLGIVEMHRGRFRLAVEAFKRALDIDPKFVEVYGALGRTYVRMRQFEKAEEAFNRAVLIESSDALRADAHYNLGMYYTSRAESAMEKQRHVPTRENQARLDTLRQNAIKHLNTFTEAAPKSDPARAVVSEKLRLLSK